MSNYGVVHLKLIWYCTSTIIEWEREKNDKFGKKKKKEKSSPVPVSLDKDKHWMHQMCTTQPSNL